jgi:hypothetical protein
MQMGRHRRYESGWRLESWRRHSQHQKPANATSSSTNTSGGWKSVPSSVFHRHPFRYSADTGGQTHVTSLSYVHKELGNDYALCCVRVITGGVWNGDSTYYAHHSKLQVITATPLIPTLYKSPQHSLSRSAAYVFTSRSPATASNSGDSSASCVQVLSSQPPVQNSTELTLSLAYNISARTT